HDETPGRRRRMRPGRGDGLDQVVRRGKLPAAGAVGAREVRVAEGTDRRGPVLFPARPEVTARETAKDGGAPGVGSFSLQRVEDLFDHVAHAVMGVAAW